MKFLTLIILLFVVILILSLEVFRKKTKPIENIAITIFALIWIGLFIGFGVRFLYTR